MTKHKVVKLMLLAAFSDLIMMCLLILAACIYFHAAGAADTTEATVAYIQSHALLSNTLIRFAQIPFVYVMCYKKMDRMEAGRETNPARWAYLLPFGIAVCILANMAVNTVINVLSQYIGAEAFTWNSESVYTGNVLPELITVAFLPALAEELVWRGAVYNGCRRIMRKPVALVLSALLFGIMHGNLMQGIYAFLLGIVFALIYDRFGSLWACILLHASANAFSVIGTEWTPLSDWMGTTKGSLVLMCASAVCLCAAVPVFKHRKQKSRTDTCCE